MSRCVCSLDRFDIVLHVLVVLYYMYSLYILCSLCAFYCSFKVFDDGAVFPPSVLDIKEEDLLKKFMEVRPYSIF